MDSKIIIFGYNKKNMQASELKCPVLKAAKITFFYKIEIR
jgi:hypothetical protein